MLGPTTPARLARIFTGRGAASKMLEARQRDEEKGEEHDAPKPLDLNPKPRGSLQGFQSSELQSLN